MKTRIAASLAAAFLALPALAAEAAKKPAAQPNPEYEATLKDIQATLGMVPDFMKTLSPVALPGAWDEMKGIQLNPKTALSGKYKELIGLAVAAQIPCRYCVYFHTQAAKLNGATDDE